VQISLYDLSTSGLEAMDGWITDWALHPADTRERFTEELLRLPTWYLRRPPASAPAIEPLPCAAAGHVTFGAFNGPAKISEPVLDAWARVLAAVPGSRLVMGYQGQYSDREVVALIRGRLAAYGVDDRLVLSTSPHSDNAHFRRVGSVDIALDTFPYSGANTTFDALWMGVPVVTLAGGRFLGRMSASILSAVGEPSLVAGSVDDYVALAAALARDRDRLARLRRELRARVAGSPVCDEVGYTRALEALYRDVWRRHCAA
jgi:predicted O-linked N-acetylglucosamine transferase (SPINDLY family)